MVYIVMVIELFKQIIENIVTLEKIIIHIYGPESVKLQVQVDFGNFLYIVARRIFGNLEPF